LSHLIDELLLAAVLVMLIASTYMGFAMQRSLYHSRKAFEALLIEIGTMGRATLNLDEEVVRLKERVEALKSDAAKTND
jgi:hypothetical protein